jgi:hypothetical protein
MTSRMHLKIGRSAGLVHTQKGTTSRMIVGSWPRVSFWRDSSANLENYGCLFVWKMLITKVSIRTGADYTLSCVSHSWRLC